MANIDTSKAYRVSDLSTILPAQYKRHKNHTRSTGTRKPGYYDLHMDKALQLRRVALSKDLPEVLQHIYDREITPDILESPLAQFGMTLESLNYAFVNGRPNIINEASIREDYRSRTGQFCIPLASAILHQKYANNLEDVSPKKDEFFPLFVVPSTDTTRAPGLPDLCLNPKISPSIEDNLKERIELDIHLLTKHHLTNVCLFEIKSLICADEEVMAAIVELASISATDLWMECGDVDCCGITVLCDDNLDRARKRHTGGDGQAKRTGRRTGPDASHEGRWWTNTYQSVGQKRFRSEEPALGNNKLDQHKDSPAEHPEIGAQARQKARYIIQQVWSELVAMDSTFGLISSGNHEIIVRRHRASGTLHMSDIVRPSTDTNPGHYKLHTALYVASYLDAVDRAQQIEALTLVARTTMAEAGEPLPPWWPLYELGVYDGDRNRYSSDMGLPTLSKAQKDQNRRIAFDILAEKLAKAELISVDIPFPNKSQALIQGAIFNRILVKIDTEDDSEGILPTATSDTPKAVAVPVHTGDDKEGIIPTTASNIPTVPLAALRLTSPIKVTETVYKVTVESDECSSGSFYMKISRDGEGRQRILEQFKGYLQVERRRKQLLKADGDTPSLAPPHYGMFTSVKDAYSSYDLVVMRDAGQSAHNLVEAAHSGVQKHVQRFNEVSLATSRMLDTMHNRYEMTHNRLTMHHIVSDAKKKEVVLLNLGRVERISQFETHTAERRERLRRDRAELVLGQIVDDDIAPQNTRPRARQEA